MLYDDLVGPQGTWLCHHGVKGQKWGVRRYQNPDGSLTPEGRQKYLKEIKRLNGKNDINKKGQLIGEIIGKKKMQACKKANAYYYDGIRKYWKDVESIVPKALKTDDDISRYMKEAGWDNIPSFLGKENRRSTISFILENMSEAGDDGVYDLKCMGAFDERMRASYNRMEQAINNYDSICRNIASEVYGPNAGGQESLDIWRTMDRYFGK